MRISLNIFFFKACPFSEWPQKYLGKCRNILPVTGAASLILPDMTYWGSSHTDFLSAVGLRAKHPHILHHLEWDFQRFFFFFLNVCSARRCCELAADRIFLEGRYIWEGNGKLKCNMVPWEAAGSGAPDICTGRWRGRRCGVSTETFLPVDFGASVNLVDNNCEKSFSWWLSSRDIIEPKPRT